MKRNFQSTGKLMGMVLRRERVSLSLWIILLSAFSIALAPMLAALFDEPARQALILTIDNPAMIAMLGPIYGIAHYTSGAMYFNMMVQWVMIAAAILNLLLVIRHTRGDEEQGRIDLLRALPTGRLASLAAAMFTALLADLVLALVTGVGIGLCAVESMDWNGAMLYGAAVGAAGLVFAALAAVFAQLCTTSRGAIGLSVAALGGLYLLRGAGDVGQEVLALLSPLGLAQRSKAFVENDWSPILLLLAESLIFTGLALRLNSRREVRQGFFPARRGREAAGIGLRSPYGLAFRLSSMPFFGWIIGMFVIGAAYGSILGTIDTFVASSEFYAMLIGTNPNFSTEQMFASMVSMEMALCAVFPVVSLVAKLRSEEKDGYGLLVLSKAVSRYRYLASYTLVSFAASVLILCAAALGIYVSALAVLPDLAALSLGYLLKANLVYAPALWVLLGLTVLLIGLVPSALPVIWVYFGFSFFVSFLGKLPDLFPAWLVKLTPFGWIPNLPTEDIHWPTLAGLTIVAAVLTAIGFAAYRRRDI